MAEPEWYATGVVLVTEVRTCKCGQVYRAPNPSLMVEYESGARRHRRQYKPGSEEHSMLPQSLVTVHSGVAACEQCFIPHSLASVQNFRDALRRASKARKEATAAAKAAPSVTPLTLDEL
jgi:hypothetical protein